MMDEWEYTGDLLGVKCGDVIRLTFIRKCRTSLKGVVGRHNFFYTFLRRKVLIPKKWCCPTIPTTIRRNRDHGIRRRYTGAQASSSTQHEESAAAPVWSQTILVLCCGLLNTVQRYVTE